MARNSSTSAGSGDSVFCSSQPSAATSVGTCVLAWPLRENERECDSLPGRQAGSTWQTSPMQACHKLSPAGPLRRRRQLQVCVQRLRQLRRRRELEAAAHYPVRLRLGIGHVKDISRMMLHDESCTKPAGAALAMSAQSRGPRCGAPPPVENMLQNLNLNAECRAVSTVIATTAQAQLNLSLWQQCRHP